MTVESASAAEATGKPAGRLTRLLRSAPVQPGQTYGVPGQGSTLFISIAAVLAALLLWFLVTETGLVKPLFLPGPQVVVEKFWSILQNGYTGAPLWEHVLISAGRVFGAFALACLIGIPLGLAMGMVPFARGLFDPFIEFYRPIPPLAYLPLMIIWFGIGEVSKVMLISAESTLLGIKARSRLSCVVLAEDRDTAPRPK